MLYNYLKIAIRNLLRHKVFSFINIFGLALGMTCSILIMLWVQDELSFNQFHTNIGRLYRVIEDQHYPGGEDLVMESTPGPLAEALKKEFPEITHATKISWDAQVLLAQGGKRYKETGFYVSPDFLYMFSFPLRKGHAATALSQPHSVVIDETLALKLFGTTDVLGRMLKINNSASYKITGT
jgi:putative ABC transport system permease protein